MKMDPLTVKPNILSEADIKKNLIDVQEMSYCIVIGVYNLHLSALLKAMQKSEPSASAICSSQM